jgi:hypothetical protein
MNLGGLKVYIYFHNPFTFSNNNFDLSLVFRLSKLKTNIRKKRSSVITYNFTFFVFSIIFQKTVVRLRLCT